MSREILLTKGFVAIVDDADFEWLSQWNWQAKPNNRLDHPRPIKWYAHCRQAGYLHRLLMSAPVGAQVDHINGTSLDCRRSNLRLCTHAQNMQNRRFTVSATGFRGVGWEPDKRRYRATIEAEGVRYRLGKYRTAIAAAAAYDEAALRLHGEFAQLNFPAIPEAA